MNYNRQRNIDGAVTYWALKYNVNILVIADFHTATLLYIR